MKKQYNLGDSVDVSNVGSGECFVCGKTLKESNVELRIALTDNGTVVTPEDLDSTWYGTDWSFRVGNECVKKFPKVSVIEEINI